MSKIKQDSIVRGTSPLAGALSIAECVNSMTFCWLQQKVSEEANRQKYTQNAAKVWNRNKQTQGTGQMTTTAAFRGGDHKPPLTGGRYDNMGSPREVVAMASVPEGATPLMYACQQSRAKELSEIIAAKPGSVRDRDRTLKTALHYCAENQRLECAELLISAAPDLLDARDEDGYTPLHLAVISGNIILVRFLLAKGASLDCIDNESHSVVHWATVCGELEALQAVLEAGAEPSTPDMHGGYPVHYAAQMCGPGSEVASDSTVGMSVLTTLLDHKVPVNVTDKDGRQPILWAASAGSADAILALFNAGANVEAEDKDGLTALHCAASRGHSECLETLITLCGAQVDLMDSNGCSPLFYAVTLGHADATQVLLNLGAQPNRQDRKGRTPAHCGAAKGQMETLRLLAQHDADLWMRNVKGDYALHEAVASGRKELVTWLLSQRPDSVNAANNDGRCPLHIAAVYNNIQMCKILLDVESLVNPVTRSSKGQLMTPLDAALYKGNRGCAKYLQLHGGVPANKLTSEAAALRGVSNRSEVEPRSEQATPEMLSVRQKEVKETRSLAPSPQREQKETHSLTTSPVTITGNRIVTLVDGNSNSHTVQLHVEGEVQVSRQEETKDVSGNEEDKEDEERIRKRRRKRQQKREEEEEDDYASEESDRRRRRRRRRRERDDYSTEEELDDSGSRGRRRKGSRRERDRSEDSEEEEESDYSDRNRRRRRSRDRRTKKSRKERKSSMRRDRSEDFDEEDKRKKKKTGKNKERTKVIKEETKRKEVIKSKKIIEERKEQDESVTTPTVSKSSITTSEERKCEEKTTKSVSEFIAGGADASRSEGEEQENVVQVVEAIVHREEFHGEVDGQETQEQAAPEEKEEEAKVEATDQEQKVQSDVLSAEEGPEETGTPEPVENSPDALNETKTKGRKSKLRRMNKELVVSKASQPELSKLIREIKTASQSEKESESNVVNDTKSGDTSESPEKIDELSEKEPETTAPEKEEEYKEEEEPDAAKQEETVVEEQEPVTEPKEEVEEKDEDEEPVVVDKEESETVEETEQTENQTEQIAEEIKTEITESQIQEEEKPVEPEPEPEPEPEDEAEEKTETAEEIAIPEPQIEETSKEDNETESKPEEPEKTSISIDSEVIELVPKSDAFQEIDVVSPEVEPETVVEKIKTEVEETDENKMDEETSTKIPVEVKQEKSSGKKKKQKREIDKKRSEEKQKLANEDDDRSLSDRSESENDLKQSFETVVERSEYKRKIMKDKKKAKSKKDVSVTLTNIVDESTAKFEDEQDISEEERTILSGDDGSIDVDTGRALVRIIGRAHEERGRRRRRRHSGERAPPRARSSFSIVSDTLSTHLDSGFEPSPRRDKSQEGRRDRSAGPELTPASVTQAVQHSIRRYHLERKIFHELLELKRLQIRAGRSNEAVLVKRLSEEYRKAALEVGLIPYQGPYQFRSFENYLYDQLRRLQLAERKVIPRLKSNDDLEKLTAALSKTRAGKAFLESVPDNPMCCTHSTHRCYHATHAYTGIPCAAYITKTNHHTLAKPPRSGFLPRIESEKRTKEGQGAEIARCLRYVDPSRPVTLELSHGKERQVISLPTENLDKNKRYYVTFTIKGGDPAPESTSGDERKHRHAKSF